MSRVVIISGKKGSGKTDLIQKIAKVFEKEIKVLDVNICRDKSYEIMPEREFIVFDEITIDSDFFYISNLKRDFPFIGIFITTQRTFSVTEQSAPSFKELFNLIEL